MSDVEPLAEIIEIGPENFLNRELSLLQFHQPVMVQAMDDSIPVLERLRFFVYFKYQS